MTDALRALAQGKGSVANIYEGKTHDAGDKLGFLKATVEIALKNPKFGDDFRNYLAEFKVVGPSSLSRTTRSAETAVRHFLSFFGVFFSAAGFASEVFPPDFSPDFSPVFAAAPSPELSFAASAGRVFSAPIIGHVPAGTFELNGRRGKLARSFGTAFRAFLDRRGSMFFDLLKQMTALLAFVFE